MRTFHFWAHHAKFIVIDDKYGFTGSMDIHSNRYKRNWREFNIRINKETAQELTCLFFQLWKFYKERNGYVEYEHCPFQYIIHNLPQKKENNNKQLYRNNLNNVYEHFIINAKNFIYLEDQYFTSSLNIFGIKNQIASAIVRRISRSIVEEDTSFRCFIIINDHTSDNIWHLLFARPLRDATIRYIYKNLSRCFSSDEIEKRLFIGSHKDKYIHSKLLIIDRQCAFVSSANINDRSLISSRDVEMTIWIKNPKDIQNCLKHLYCFEKNKSEIKEIEKHSSAWMYFSCIFCCIPFQSCWHPWQ